MIRVALPFCLSLGWCCFPSSVKALCKCPHTQRHTRGLLPRIVELDSSGSNLTQAASKTNHQNPIPSSLVFEDLPTCLCWFLGFVSALKWLLFFFWSSFPPLYFLTLWKNYPCINSPVWLLFDTHFWDVLCVIFFLCSTTQFRVSYALFVLFTFESHF